MQPEEIAVLYLFWDLGTETGGVVLS